MLKRLAEIRCFYLNHAKKSDYFWIMRIETGNLIVRGIDTIRKFLITEDYGMLLDPKNSKCVYGFFIHDFENLKNQSTISLDTALIQEKSTRSNIKHDNKM